VCQPLATDWTAVPIVSRIVTSAYRSDRLWGPPIQPSIHSVPGTQRSVREAVHPAPTYAEVQIAWIYTPVPPYVFMAYCLVKQRQLCFFSGARISKPAKRFVETNETPSARLGLCIGGRYADIEFKIKARGHVMEWEMHMFRVPSYRPRGRRFDSRRYQNF
jgi:hypothetical protein